MTTAVSLVALGSRKRTPIEASTAEVALLGERQLARYVRLGLLRMQHPETKEREAIALPRGGRLRRLRESDADVIAGWLGDSELRKRVLLRPGPDTTLVPPSVDDVRKMISRLNREGESFGIVASSGALVGYVGFKPDRHERRRELFVVVGDRRRWGAGLGVRAARTLLRHGFDALGLDEVSAEVFTFNVDTVRLLEKAGFVREGTSEQRVFDGNAYLEIARYHVSRSSFSRDVQVQRSRPVG
jgi:RimJ/RimL family protein N-acetyltransferase